jgi:lipopolysaccharide biosynthesis protein
MESYGPINKITNVTIILHLFNVNLFSEMQNYINNVKAIFKFVNILITINKENSYFEMNIKEVFQEAIIIYVENKGVDIYSFIVCISYIRKNNIKTDYILKLHTKESSNDYEQLYEWRKDLIDPITKYNNLLIIQNYFNKINNIGYIASQKCILPKKYDIDFPHNIMGIYELCDKFPHLERNWIDFVAGTIFWINNECLTKYLTDELITYLSDRFIYKKPPCNLRDKGIYVEYLCERLFTGSFCYNSNNILVTDYDITHRGLIINDNYFYQPKIFSISIPKNIIEHTNHEIQI